MDSEVVIFCESYPQIKNALYAATHGGNRPVTLVITGNPNLLKFFAALNERVFQKTLNLVYFEVYQGRMAKSGNKVAKALYLLPDIMAERRYLAAIFDRYFARLRGAEVYFFSGCFNASTFYLLEKLGKTNRLAYMPDPSYDTMPIPGAAPGNLTDLVYLARCKLVYGRDIAMGKHPLGLKVTCMPDRFFRQRVGRVVSREERDTLLKELDLARFRVFESGNYSLMYFHEDLVEHDYIRDAAAFRKALNQVFDIVRRHFPENKVALKYHPNATEGKVVEFGEVLPDFIPAEFLYNEKIKVYLGLCSMALANVEKGLAVSLLDLVGFKNDTIRERLREILTGQSRTRVLFPKSLDEFEKILVNAG